MPSSTAATKKKAPTNTTSDTMAQHSSYGFNITANPRSTICSASEPRMAAAKLFI
ncbi:uncharacterized protein G2W53_003633 [Senna tora]|uniref:Uncharacterized protein n=1 Tax=Senna tora TaxID=362788 RepID=A0A835CIL3_9FABA|nr:uncharacterized protein G2W53_003633 [Senna tora]